MHVGHQLSSTRNHFFRAAASKNHQRRFFLQERVTGDEKEKKLDDPYQIPLSISSYRNTTTAAAASYLNIDPNLCHQPQSTAPAPPSL